jgi:hypothetical protein
MSQLVVHYDPSQRSCYFREAVRDKQARVFEKARPSCTIIGAQSPSSVPVKSQKQRKSANYEQLNRQFLQEVQDKNRRALNQSIRLVGREVKKEFTMRERNAKNSNPTAMQELALPSPRRAREGTAAARFLVADHSSGSGTAGAIEFGDHNDGTLNRSLGVVPAYIEDAKDACRMRGGERVALKQLAVAEASFPPGTEPLSPARTFRSREFFESEVAELSQKLNDFSFVKANSLPGQKQKSQLEQKLRQAEQQVLLFQHPVVFVKTPNPVLAPPPKPAASWR